MNKAVDLSLFEKLLKIIGHTDEEAQELSEKMFTGIMQRTLILAAAKLEQSDRDRVLEMTKEGKGFEEVFNFVGSKYNPEEIRNLSAGMSAKYMEEYYDKISKDLSEEQKKEISLILFKDNA